MQCNAAPKRFQRSESSHQDARGSSLYDGRSYRQPPIPSTVRQTEGCVQDVSDFRPDKVYAVENNKTWIQYLEKLESASGKSITSYGDLLSALQARVDYFDSLGCRA